MTEAKTPLMTKAPPTTKAPITPKPKPKKPKGMKCTNKNITKYLDPREETVKMKISVSQRLFLEEGIHIYKKKKGSEICETKISVLSVGKL